MLRSTLKERETTTEHEQEEESEKEKETLTGRKSKRKQNDKKLCEMWPHVFPGPRISAQHGMCNNLRWTTHTGLEAKAAHHFRCGVMAAAQAWS